MGKIAIVGLGLIGGSIGLALKRAAPIDTEVVGYDRDSQVGARAAQFGAVQKAAHSLEAAVDGANMVIIATPVINVRRVLETIGPRMKPGTVVTDTASTKTEVMRWAEEYLPQGVHFVGGHPMAGKEKAGPQAAEESLFDGRPWCIVPTMTASTGAVNAVVSLARAVGAEPFFLDASEHDAYAAAISHIPLLASVGLFNLARGSSAWPELAGMAGTGFKDLTRLASGEPEMAHDIFITNRTHVLHWLDRYIDELRKLATMIESDDRETLFRALAETQIERDNYLENPPKRETPGPELDIPSSSEAMLDLMAGSLWRNRAKELTDGMTEGRQRREREERLRRREE